MTELKDIRCFLLDMDGTFYLGDRIIEGSLSFIDKLIETGRLLFRFENTMYGTMGPEHHVYDENYTESDFDKAFESLKKTRKRRKS